MTGSSSASASSGDCPAGELRPSLPRAAARFHQRREEQLMAMGAESAYLIVAGVGNAQHVRQFAVEQLIDMHLVRGTERAGQCQPMFGQQSARGRVASQQLALVAQRQQVASVDQTNSREPSKQRIGRSRYRRRK